MADLARDGFTVFDADARVRHWARTARTRARIDEERRHGGTWSVGVDALDNARDGSIEGVPLTGPWADHIAGPDHWHRAQVSVIYPGFPGRDPTESEASHQFRVNRCGAHVDGLHLEDDRRVVREPHAFVLGIPLNDSTACPLVVWPGSHRVMGAAVREVCGEGDPIGADVTEVYKAARARVFGACDPVRIVMVPGQSVLLDRFALHGVAPWRAGDAAPPEGRMVAYFRPQFTDARDWLRA